MPAFPVFKGLSEVLIRQEEAVYHSEKKLKSQNPSINTRNTKNTLIFDMGIFNGIHVRGFLGVVDRS